LTRGRYAKNPEGLVYKPKPRFVKDLDGNAEWYEKIK